MATNKGYPRSRFDIIDQSAAKTVPVSDVKNPMPLAIQTFTSDKGSEDWKVYDNFDKFLNETGAINYQKHGQPQLTVAEILRSGGAVLAKRLVEKDATFAQKTVCANIVTLNIPDNAPDSNATQNATNNEVVNLQESFRSNKKSFLYYSVSDTPIKIMEQYEVTENGQTVKKTRDVAITKIANAKTTTELFNMISEYAEVSNGTTITKKLPYFRRVRGTGENSEVIYTPFDNGNIYDPNNETASVWDLIDNDANDANDESAVSFSVKTYPLFTISAIGRGKSTLYFKIEPESEFSSRTDTEVRIFKYTISVYDTESNSGNALETFRFSLHPDASINGISLSLDSKLLDSTQVRCSVYENILNTFMTDLTEAIGNSDYTKSDLMARDILCGRKYNKDTGYLPNIIASSADDNAKIKCFNVTKIDTTVTTGEEPNTTTETVTTYERSVNTASDAPTYNIYDVITSGISNIITFENGATIKLDNGTGCNDDSYVKIINGYTTYTDEYVKMLKAVFGSVIDEDDNETASPGNRETYPYNVEHALSLEQYEDIISGDLLSGKIEGNRNMKFTNNLYANYLFSSEIYDLDKYKIDFTFDNNYPMDVKHIIIDLTEYRGDMVFLCDLGFNLTTLKAIKTAKATLDGEGSVYSSKFVAVYHNSCKVVNPYTSKQIRVTMPFVMIPVFVDHLENNGAGYAFAGMVNNMVFPNIVPGSINYIPVDVPVGSQKQELVNINVNYLSYYGALPVMDTMYVNQTQFTQLSYLHNIIAIQGIIKKIRETCPRSRYTFLNSGDLQNYINDVSALLNEYATYFDQLSVQYMADEQYEQNNIFYATLTVKCKNFIQEEYFRIIAIS